MDKEKIKTKEDWLKFFLESYELIGFRIFKNFENNKKIFIGSSTVKKSVDFVILLTRLNFYMKHI